MAIEDRYAEAQRLKARAAAADAAASKPKPAPTPTKPAITIAEVKRLEQIAVAAEKKATTAANATPGIAPIAASQNPLTTPYPTTSVADLNAANIAARKATEAYASPFSTAFGGTAPSTALDYARIYASPFSDIFGGGAPAVPYSPSSLVNPVTGAPAAPMTPYTPPYTPPITPPVAGNDWTNQIYILIAKLKASGLPASTAERAGVFFTALLDDGITNEDNAIDIFLFSKTYKSKKTNQEIPSPYYTDFGKFNDGLSSAKPPGVLVPWVLGIKDTLKKYNPGSLYETDESIQKYLKNGVKVSDLDGNLNAARLRSITADPVYTNALIRLGYIKDRTGLTGFFASPDLGQQQLEINRNTGAFATEALRREKQGGIKLDTGFAKTQAADLTAQGYTEAQIANIAEKGYQNIGRDIIPTVKLSGIYQGAKAANAASVQNELQQQEFMGMDSELTKTVGGMEIGAFSGSSGNIRSPRISSYKDDITGQL